MESARKEKGSNRMAALLAVPALTAGFYFADFGPASPVAALALAAVKAVLVVNYVIG
jgi:hypothetical protein